MTEILAFQPTALEGLDHLLYEFVKAKGDETANLKLPPDGKGFLMVEFGGDSIRDSCTVLNTKYIQSDKSGAPIAHMSSICNLAEPPAAIAASAPSGEI